MELDECGTQCNELDRATRMTEKYKRMFEVCAAERDHARACYERTVQILCNIHALLSPPVITLEDGRTFEFRSPTMANQQLQALSDRIRAVPDELNRIVG